MRVTRAADYAVRCMLYLSMQGNSRVVGRREVAQAMEIPTQFLGKIAQQLARAGLMEIIQGPKGGYRLLLSPKKITLLDVIEAIYGEIFLSDCILRPESCSRSSRCAVHGVWERARNQLRETLRKTSFADLAEEELCVDIPLRSCGLKQGGDEKEP